MTRSTARRTRAGLFAPALALVASLATITIGRNARADHRIVRRISLRFDAGAGTMISDFQRSQLGFNVAIQGGGRVGFDIVDWLAVQAGLSYWGFTSNGRGDGGVVFIGAGPRLQIPTRRIGRVIGEFELGWARTGPDSRFMFDAGLGYEFNLASWIALGPMARYGHVVAADIDVPSDAQFWSVGVSATWRMPEEAPPTPAAPLPIAAASPPPDRDLDGVADASDLCIDEPRGDHPDSQRPGCPLRDTDGDLVFDDTDVCVTTPAGANPDPERAGCPDGDQDGDLALDHVDQCRTVASGLHPDPDRTGCPLADRDGDNVPDAVDHCPDRPGAPNPNPRRNGCPGLVLVDAGRVRILRPILFATNRDRILPRSFPVLQAVLWALDANPLVRRLAIDGHTDNVGDDARNLDLSVRRSRAVFAWLVSHGLDPSRLESHGYGETRPIATNDTRAGRANNRRVEFLIADPAPHETATAGVSTAPSSAPSVSSTSSSSPGPTASNTSSAPAASPPLVADNTNTSASSAPPPPSHPRVPSRPGRPRTAPRPVLSGASGSTSVAVSTPIATEPNFTPANGPMVR